MKFVNPIFKKLFGAKQEDIAAEQDAKHLAPVEEIGVEVESAVVHLELPHEHSLYRLYDLRTEEAGGIPSPEFILEGLEGLTESRIKQELTSFCAGLTKEADMRLKEAVPEKPEESGTAEEETLEAAEETTGEEAAEAVEEIIGEEAAEAVEETAVEDEAEEIEMDALPFIFISSDRMFAWIMAFPPVGSGKELDREMLEDVLKKNKITYGVDEELLEKLKDAPDRYFHLFTIAKGKPVVDGEDGHIIDYFPRRAEREFEMDEYGNVDYMSIGAGKNVQKDEVICETVPPTEGVPGCTVLGREIRCRNGKAAALPKGKNTEISEDGSKLLASQDGRVEFSNRAFHVKLLLEIPGNVDYSTGSINFIGDVHIRGDVCSGFSVRTMGDIKVDGVVEACEIEAGGDLIVAKGIAGNMETVVRAQRNVYAKYLGNSIVHARQNVHTDSILYSDVYSDGEIHVCSGRGTIVGGKIRAARGIHAKTVGSKYESVTTVILGGQPYADAEKEILSKNIEELKAELEKLERQPDSPVRTKRMGKIRLDISVNGMKLKKFDKELEKIKEQLEEQGGSQLKCSTVYPGVVVTIGDQTVTLDRETNSCHARLVDGELFLL